MSVTDRPAFKSWFILWTVLGTIIAPSCQQSENARGAIGIKGDDSSNGIRVTAVMRKSPAEQAGLRAGDLIVRLNDIEAADTRFILAQKPGTQITISYARNDRNLQAVATVGDRLVVYSAAASAGDAHAEAILGSMYMEGDLVTKDEIQAVTWLTAAANQSEPYALLDLGLAYTKGKGVTKDEAKGQDLLHRAVVLLRKAAESEELRAEDVLGWVFASGNGVPNDFEEAIRWWRKAAEKGYPRAESRLGWAFANGRGTAKDETEALKWWRLAAQKEDSLAEAELGRAYFDGHGLAKDEAEALKWWRKAAEQGDAFSQNGLGVAYSNGRGVDKDEAEALKWWRKAAEQDHPSAEANLGWAYFFGRGVARDQTAGVKWWKKAAEQEISYAQFHLGEAYFSGQGVGKDRVEALRWYQRAAEHGHADSQRMLASLAYNRGDLVDAFVWYSLSAAAGNQGAKDNLGLPRLKSLTEEQLSIARSRVSAWTVFLQHAQELTAAAEKSERAGQLREALNQYLVALLNLPEPVPLDADARLREKIIKLVASLQPQPAIPEEASRHEVYAKLAFKNSQTPEDLDKSLKEWKLVLGLAPWWAEAYFNSAIILEKRGDYLQAARNLRFYLAAATAANDANEVRQKMYALEYQANEKIN
jgi:TPR repeat protein